MFTEIHSGIHSYISFFQKDFDFTVSKNIPIMSGHVRPK